MIAKRGRWMGLDFTNIQSVAGWALAEAASEVFCILLNRILKRQSTLGKSKLKQLGFRQLSGHGLGLGIITFTTTLVSLCPSLNLTGFSPWPAGSKATRHGKGENSTVGQAGGSRQRNLPYPFNSFQCKSLSLVPLLPMVELPSFTPKYAKLISELIWW